MNDTRFYDAMNEVLATSRYDRLMGRRSGLREIVSGWINALLERIFSGLNINISPPDLSYDLDIIALVFVFIGAILVVVAGTLLYRTYKRRNQMKHHDLSDIFEELTRKNYTVAELIQLSENADNRRLATRYRYIAALVALNEKQIIEIKPSATNALISQQIKDTTPVLLVPFECTADVFQRAWFGYKNIHDDVYENFTKAVDALLNYRTRGDAQ